MSLIDPISVHALAERFAHAPGYLVAELLLAFGWPERAWIGLA